MTKEAAANEKVRLTLDLSATINRRLDEIADDTGRSKSDLMRMAIDFLLRAQEAKRDDMTVGAWKEDKERHVRVEREFVGLNG